MQTLIIDYGLGNIGSLCNALSSLNIDWQVASNFEEAANVDIRNLILPGVGSFDAGMNGLKERNFHNFLKEKISKGTPCLGICLGMQLLLSSSEESKTSQQGLNLIEGKVISLPDISLPIPHIGWSSTILSNKKFLDKENLKSLSSGLISDFYYIHSYVSMPKNKNNIFASFKYGNSYQTAAIIKDNIVGVQFHPEKSQTAGLNFLKKFNNTNF